jgi:AraC family ethanolamine operon transcriptional activator
MGQSTTVAPPVVTSVDITDLTASASDMDILEEDGMALQSQPLHARRVLVRLDSAMVVYQSTNLRVRTRSMAHDGLLAYVTFGPRAAGSAEGIQVRAGMMLVAEPETEVGFVADPGYESVAFLVRPEFIRRHLADRRREAEFRWPRGVEVLHTEPARARDLFKWGKRLTDTASAQPELFRRGCLERDAAQVDLLEALLECMRSADTLVPQGAEKTRWAHNRIVSVAEHHVLERAGERTYLSDLCQAADVSERTLECAFKEVTGLSPMAYLTRLRLHRVRAALLAAKSRSTRISAEALKWGFWHFGEFSHSYRKCFGELPSDTLRRAQTPDGLGAEPVAAP